MVRMMMIKPCYYYILLLSVISLVATQDERYHYDYYSDYSGDYEDYEPQYDANGDFICQGPDTSLDICSTWYYGEG